MPSRPGAPAFHPLAPRIRIAYDARMAANYPHVISFRVTASEGRKLQRLRATFPEQKWGEMFRWLIDRPAVQAEIEQRLADDLGSAQDDGSGRPWGVEASLPLGDR